VTQIGHTLTGLALGVLGLPSSPSKVRCAIQLAAFVVLANIPDMPAPYWGHARYDISHSMFVNLILSLLALAAMVGFHIADWTTLRLGMAAWFSHMLLDALYNHGQGVRIFWPFSAATLALPISWFSVLPNPTLPITTQEIRIGLIEFCSYAPLVLISMAARNRDTVWCWLKG
jgi:membrane-bound metal-dependent hydrolase YbcI (DUF457 family)